MIIYQSSWNFFQLLQIILNIEKEKEKERVYIRYTR